MNALQTGVLREQVNTAKRHLLQAGGHDGLGRIFEELQLDVLVAPGDAALSSLAAAAGMFNLLREYDAFELNVETNK